MELLVLTKLPLAASELLGTLVNQSAVTSPSEFSCFKGFSLPRCSQVASMGFGPATGWAADMPDNYNVSLRRRQHAIRCVEKRSTCLLQLNRRHAAIAPLPVGCPHLAGEGQSILSAVLFSLARVVRHNR